ncbi:MAG: SsrA-binding protein SmpB [Patescibacteria group bacterium]
MPVIVTNKHALHDYEILERFEAGIVLSGQEVKSVRAGAVSLKASYATLSDKGMSLLNASISPYPSAGPLPSYDPTRSRRLLLTKKELSRLTGKLHTKGLTLVPLKIYTVRSLIKLELGLGRGKKQFEKRELLKKRDVEREIRQHLKQ